MGHRRATFTEVEIELNEKRYTAATEPERARMRQILDTLRADLLRQFPALKQDQRPKYQKMAELLAVRPAPRAAPAVTSAAPAARKSRLIPWSIIGAFVGIGVGRWLWRRRKV